MEGIYKLQIQIDRREKSWGLYAYINILMVCKSKQIKKTKKQMKSTNKKRHLSSKRKQQRENRAPPKGAKAKQQKNKQRTKCEQKADKPRNKDAPPPPPPPKKKSKQANTIGRHCFFIGLFFWLLLLFHLLFVCDFFVLTCFFHLHFLLFDSFCCISVLLLFCILIIFKILRVSLGPANTKIHTVCIYNMYTL